MTLQDAEKTIVEKWQTITDQSHHCAMQIDPARTVEYEWGWSFSFVPVNPAEHGDRFPRSTYAIDRVTGITSPVGTKGVADAVNYLMKWRKKRAEAQAESPAGE